MPSPDLLLLDFRPPQQHMRFSATHPPTYFPPEPDTLKGWVLAGQEREREGSKSTELHPSPGPACGHRSSLLSMNAREDRMGEGKQEEKGTHLGPLSQSPSLSPKPPTPASYLYCNSLHHPMYSKISNLTHWSQAQPQQSHIQTLGRPLPLLGSDRKAQFSKLRNFSDSRRDGCI